MRQRMAVSASSFSAAASLALNRVLFAFTFSTQLLSCKGQDYFTNTIVHCPPDHRFEEPLLLDFFLDDPAVSNEKATLKQVLERYQVCFLRASHTWSIRKSLELTRKVCWVAAQITLLT